MADDEATRELRAAQAARERSERERAEETSLPDEARQHERRADKAAYLEAKLAERAAAEEGDA